MGGSVGSSQGGLTETLAEVRDSGGSLFLVVQLFFLHCEALEKGGRQDELNDNSPNESERTNCEANQVLFPGKGHSSESTATELGDADLDGEGEHSDEEEDPVVEESGEHVEISGAELASVDLVEQLHEHEGLEHHGVEVGLVGGVALNESKVFGVFGNPVAGDVERSC